MVNHKARQEITGGAPNEALEKIHLVIGGGINFRIVIYIKEDEGIAHSSGLLLK